MSSVLAPVLIVSLFLSSVPTAPQQLIALKTEVALNLLLWYHHSGFRELLQGRGSGAEKKQETQADR
ncbi:MAG TPA: hypothetical protein VN843_35195, partial [Anaerolineales bacterium]|nr:hypothetical protein [Anaerolineales bacterium]